MFERDRSAARGEMATRKLVVFNHVSALDRRRVYLPFSARIFGVANQRRADLVRADSIELPRTLPSSSDQTGERDAVDLRLQGLDEARAPSADAHARALGDWVRSYLMRPHPDLGRSGHVCPFTAQAVRLSLLRIGVSPLAGQDRGAILQTMRHALRAFDALPCQRSTRVFRTVIIAFPSCADTAGIATLHAVQNALRHHSIVGAKMIGLFESDSQAEGLLNPQFRPLRSPVPALAIRMLVEQDAPFVARNPLLAPIYLAKFPIVGTRRLLRHATWPGIVRRLTSRLPRRPRP